MDNASQALIIAGTILIAIIVLSMGVYLITNSSTLGESYDKKQELTELTKFNSRFTVFEAREDITAQEIVTLSNYVKNYNIENDPDISIVPNIFEREIEFIKENSPDKSGKLKYFKCIECKIDSNTGRVCSIVFSK